MKPTTQGLVEQLEALSAPRDVGEVVRLVARPAQGERMALKRAHLDVGGGMPGDRWPQQVAAHPGRYDDSAISMMRADALDVLSRGGDPLPAGDNLQVLLDLSFGNLPIGTTLRIGGAVCQVTPKAHNGCRKFRERYGEAALRATAMRPMREARIRGLFVRVIEAGEVSVGASIVVLQRA